MENATADEGIQSEYNAFETAFNEESVAIGDQIIAKVGDFEIRATLVTDTTSNPVESFVTDDVDLLAEVCETWAAGDWFYTGIVIDVYREGRPFNLKAASIQSVECNLSGSNKHLTQLANNLLCETVHDLEAMQPPSENN